MRKMNIYCQFAEFSLNFLCNVIVGDFLSAKVQPEARQNIRYHSEDMCYTG